MEQPPNSRCSSRLICCTRAARALLPSAAAELKRYAANPRTVTRRVSFVSAQGDATVHLEVISPDWFSATIHCRGLDAVGRVSSYQSAGLAALFQGFARDWRGWSGHRTWQSLEGELELSASSDRTGHVHLSVMLHDRLPPVWSANVDVVLEAGALEQLARDVEAFERIAIPVT